MRREFDLTVGMGWAGRKVYETRALCLPKVYLGVGVEASSHGPGSRARLVGGRGSMKFAKIFFGMAVLVGRRRRRRRRRGSVGEANDCIGNG